MPKRHFFVVPVLALAALGSAAACDSGSTAADTDASPIADAGALADAGELADAAGVSCAPPTAVADESALLTLLGGVPWSYVGPYSTGRMPVTDDVSFTADVVLDAARLAEPEPCATSRFCRPLVGLKVSESHAGVTCDEADEHGWLRLCGKVGFAAGTAVRFRAMFQDTHPSEWNYVPIIEVLSSCAAGCGDGQLRCPADNTCWSGFSGYCRHCLEEDNTVCPCQTADGPEPDGEDCAFMVSGDVICSGECSSGVCEYNGTPGWAGCP